MFAEIYLRFLLENNAKVILKYTKSGVSQVARLWKATVLTKNKRAGLQEEGTKIMRKILLATTFLLMNIGTAQAASVEIPMQRFDLSLTNSASFANDSTRLASIIENFGGRLNQGTMPSNLIIQLFDAPAPSLSSVPAPAAVWLLAPALGLFALVRRKVEA